MPELKKELSLLQATFYGIGIILGAGIYVLLGEAAGIAGNAVWIAFGLFCVEHDICFKRICLRIISHSRTITSDVSHAVVMNNILRSRAPCKRDMSYGILNQRA